MGRETIKSNFLLSDSESHSLSSVLFDLPALVEKLKLEQSWVKDGLKSMILLKTPDEQIILTAMHDQTEISSFQSNESITFQIIEGKLTFHSHNESITLDKGQLLTLHENIKYSLTTKEETILLLTIASNVLRLSVN